MADRMLFISWGEPVRGREERGLEVFNEALGICGRMQQEGRIEKFEVRLMGPNGGLNGYIEIHGSAAQIAAVKEDDEFLSNTMDAANVAQDLRHVDGWINEGIARAMEMYQEGLAKVPEHA
jgi:hypothetical protein